MERANSDVESGITLSSAIVEIDHLFQCADAAVVHVGRGSAHFAERGRFECAAVSSSMSDAGSPFVGNESRSPRDASVVKFFVREIRSGMTSAAACLATKQSET